jgi:hypothetical protein
MIGFEAELDVPTFQKLSLDGMEPGSENIYSFLFGGYKDTSVTAGAVPYLKIKPDVSDYATVGEALTQGLSAFLKLEPFMKKHEKGVLITKLEYETTALPEADADSDQFYSKQAKLITEHARQLISRAKLEVFAVLKPAANMWAGVPVSEIEFWIERGRQRPEQEAQKRAEMTVHALGKMLDKVRDRFAIQATAGVFPSVIPTLFEQGEKPLDQPSAEGGEAWKIAYPLIVSAIQQVLNEPTIMNHQSLQVLANNEVYREAFKGHLYLLCSYLVGDALSVSSMFEKKSAKNAVPYHAKINLGYAHKAMPEGFREPLPVKLAQSIADVLTTQECTKLEFWLKQNLGLTRIMHQL